VKYLLVLVFAMGVDLVPVTVAWPQDGVIDVPFHEVGTRFRLLGALGEPFGKTVTIRGVVIPDPAKEFGPTFLVRQVDGNATQKSLIIQLKCDDELVIGQDYELTGHELGGYQGVPSERMLIVIPAGHGLSYKSEFVVDSVSKIKPITFRPSDFLGRECLFAGIAERVKEGASSEDLIRGDGWTIVYPLGFTDDAVGKLVEIRGRFRPRLGEPATFESLVGARWRLVALNDQINREVELRGIACRLNENAWYLEYRGTSIYVEGLGNQALGIKFKAGDSIVVRGTLTRRRFPRLGENRNVNPENEHREEYVVVDAKTDRSDQLLAEERVFRGRGIEGAFRLPLWAQKGAGGEKRSGVE